MQRCAERIQDGNLSEKAIVLDVVNFIVLGAEYIYISVNIFELCFRIQLSYLETG